MNMYVIDIEQIVRDEVRKLVLANLAPKPTPKAAAPAVRQKKTRVSIIHALGVNETHTFRCPKGKALNKFREVADQTARYVARRYGAKYRTHRIDGGLQVTRVG
jgi:hypothetical protein